MTDTSIKIVELWVYPVKACRGVKVDSAKVTPTGLEHDRSWCIVDLEGTHVPKLEAISQRRMPCLATIEISFNQQSKICMHAPGMSILCLPTTPADLKKAMHSAPILTAECAGSSWSLGFLDCRVHAEGSKWVTDYLNQPKPDDDSGRLINGKMTKGQFALVKSMGVVDMATYPPIFPLIERAQHDPSYQKRFEGNVRLFSDFSPYLLVSQSSARHLADLCATKEYPITSFRGNIVVDGDSLAPWEEESWSSLEISTTSSPTMNNNNNDTTTVPLITLKTIKQCPRCTVPCRDQATGKFLFAKEQVKLWNVLKKAFPRKYSDPEWGAWAGAYFGVYMGGGHTSIPKEEEIRLTVGNVITPVDILPWDSHLRSANSVLGTRKHLVMVVSAAVGAVAIVAGVLRLMNT